MNDWPQVIVNNIFLASDNKSSHQSVYTFPSHQKKFSCLQKTLPLPTHRNSDITLHIYSEIRNRRTIDSFRHNRIMCLPIDSQQTQRIVLGLNPTYFERPTQTENVFTLALLSLLPYAAVDEINSSLINIYISKCSPRSCIQFPFE